MSCIGMIMTKFFWGSNDTNWSTIWLPNVECPGNFECDLLCVINILKFWHNNSPLICENNKFNMCLNIETTAVAMFCTIPTTLTESAIMFALWVNSCNTLITPNNSFCCTDPKEDSWTQNLSLVQ